jgi:hypothetical protein
VIGPLSTVRHAGDLDYRLVVVRDCCADPDAEVHAMLLDIVIAKQAAIVTTAELAAARSEHRNRIDRRSRRIGERQRVDGQHELPPIAGGRRLAQHLQIRAVEHMDTPDRLDEIVNGVSEQITRGLRCIPGGFLDDRRNVAPLQPRKDRIVEPGIAFFRTKIGSPPIVAPAKHQRSPRLHADTRFVFPRLHVLGKDAVARRDAKKFAVLNTVLIFQLERWGRP